MPKVHEVGRDAAALVGVHKQLEVRPVNDVEAELLSDLKYIFVELVVPAGEKHPHPTETMAFVLTPQGASVLARELREAVREYLNPPAEPLESENSETG